MPRYSLSDDLDDEEEHEPPHPIGFGSQWDRTSWIGWDAGRCTYALDDEDYGDQFTCMTRGSYPPLSAYIATASTPILLKYRGAEEKQHYYEDDDVLALQEFLQNQSMTSPSFTHTPTKSTFPNVSLHIAEKMELERRRMEKEHLAVTQGVESLLLDLDRQTAVVLKEIKEADEARQELELAAEKKRQQEQEDVRKKKEAEDANEQAKLHAQAEAEKDAKDDKQRRDDVAAAKTEYIAKARKIVAQLVQVRESIEPFDKNKMVSKRRLGMKKIVGGRINTLAENTEKIQQVATEVGQAIAQARQEDEHIKAALERKDPGYTADMARGKRYLVDLLASNTIQRIQADGFNGPRGDGFPLASMLAMVSLENKEIVPILAAHVYTVCPTAIPTLPSPKKDATEDELMESLGMQKDKNGEYESFDKFLTRTESIVTFVSNIMASSPSSHVLFGGHIGAVKWLERFLDLLPDPPAAPLPLLTAPVLHGFLSGAGHMLANKHQEIFQNQIKKITDEVMNRLDDGPIGKPSSIRLEKLMEGGLEKFKATVPERALPELYYGANAGAGHGRHGGGDLGGTTPFGSSTSQATGGNFAGSAPRTSNPFGGSSDRNAESTPINPFGGVGGGTSSFGMSSTALGGSSFISGVGARGDGMSTEPSSTQSTPFGTTPSGNTPFGTSSGGFGGQASSSPFGAPSQFPSAPTPFGSSISAPAPAIFGASGIAPAPSGFGASGFGASGFGALPSSTGVANAAVSSPFGGVANSNPSPFGASGAGGTAFGGGSSFDGGRSNNSQPFGGGRGNGDGRGAGAGRGGSGKMPCKFFAQGRCRFGDSCKFSHENSGAGSFGNNSGRGNGGRFGDSFAQSSPGFGGGASPFSGGGFGGGNASNPFGAPRR